MANVTNIEIRAQDRTTTAFRKVNGGLTKLDSKLKTTSGNLGLFNGGLGKMAGLMGGVIGVAAITNFSKNLLKVGDRLQKVSLQLGISVEQLEIYQFAASQSGVNTNGNLKDSPALFAEVATAISNLQSPTEKIRIATDLFGKSGVELVPLLNAGEQGIKNFEKTLRDAGGIIGGDAADAMAVFNDKIDIMTTGLRGKLAPVLIAILPALTLLVDNFDNIATTVTLLASTFIAAKIPAFITAIAVALKALTIAMLTNPMTALAVAITGIGAAIYLHGDTIAGWFGFAKPASKDVKNVNTDLEESTAIIEDVNKVTKKRIKLAEKVAKTTKKELIPSLKKLEEGLGETQLKFVNLTGREGLGGIQLAFRNFFMNVWADATFYLGGTSATIKKNFANMKQDFEEFFIALSNIVIFEGKNVRNEFSSLLYSLETNVTNIGVSIVSAFSVIMTNLESRINAISYEFNTTVAVPANIFAFKPKSIIVPASTFDTSAVSGAQAHLNSLVGDINSFSYSAAGRSLTRNASAIGRKSSDGLYHDAGVKPMWTDNYEPLKDDITYGNADLNMPVPSVAIKGGSVARNASASRSPASVNAYSGGGGNSVTVNIYDGTGQKISAYDSGIRVEITERAARNGQFSALT